MTSADEDSRLMEAMQDEIISGIAEYFRSNPPDFGYAIEWISENMSPERVFTEDDLNDWASGEGWISGNDLDEIERFAKDNGYVSEGNLNDWALDNGYVHEDDLDDWAIDHDYVKKEDLDILPSDNGDYIHESVVRKWAEEQGYIPERDAIGYVSDIELETWAINNGWVKKSEIEQSSKSGMSSGFSANSEWEKGRWE